VVSNAGAPVSTPELARLREENAALRRVAEAAGKYRRARRQGARCCDGSTREIHGQWQRACWVELEAALAALRREEAGE